MIKIKTDKYSTHMEAGVTGSSRPIFIAPVLSTYPGSLQIFEQTQTFFPFSHLIFNFLHMIPHHEIHAAGQTRVFMVWNPWTRRETS